MNPLFQYDIRSVPDQFNPEFIRNSGLIKLYEDSHRIIIGHGPEYDGSTLNHITGGAERPVQTVALEKDEFLILSRSLSLWPSKKPNGTSGDPLPEVHIAGREPIDVGTGSEPAVELANGLIHEAIVREASDLHIEPSGGKIRVRLRVHGVLTTVRVLNKAMERSLVTRFKVTAGVNVLESSLPQEGRFTVTAGKCGIHARVSFMPTVSGESVSVRLLRMGEAPLSLESLGFSPKCLDRLVSAVRTGRGLILVAGPTGSGKTTTIYALIEAVGGEERKTVSIEDPVERMIPGAIQISARPEAGFGFARLAKMVLRHDPDIIIIGEIRDEETAEVAVRAALTGHLVIASIHTAEAAETIPRLSDMGIPAYLIAAVLNGVLAQRLVRTVCPGCVEYRRAHTWEREILQGHGIEEIMIAEGGGCESCSGTGFAGRTALGEFLRIDREISRLICASPSREEFEQAVQGAVPRSLAGDGFDKTAAGITTPAEILRSVPFSFPPAGDPYYRASRIFGRGRLRDVGNIGEEDSGDAA